MRGILALALDARDFIAGGVLLALQTFDFGNEPPPPRLERCELLEIGVRIEPAVAIAGAHLIEVIAHQSRVNHG